MKRYKLEYSNKKIKWKDNPIRPVNDSAQIANQIKNHLKANKRQEKENYQKQGQFHSSLLSKVATSKKESVNSCTLKSRFDALVQDLFVKIDFDSSGFITNTKISYYKQLPQNIFYFFGGVFQKIKQLGAVTLKTFSSLCNQTYIKANVNDLQAIFCQNHQTNKHLTNINGKKKNIKINLKSKNQKKQQNVHQQSNSSLKNELSEQFSTKKIDRSIKKLNKYSLKLRTQPDYNQTYSKYNRKSTASKTSAMNLLNSSNREISHHKDQVSEFQTEKVRILTERLDRQISQSKQRLFTNKFIR